MNIKGLFKTGENKNEPHTKSDFLELGEGNESPFKYYIPETKETGNISQNKLSHFKKDTGKTLDDKIAEITFESEKGYQKIASRVVSIAGSYLSKQCDNKQDLRNLFVKKFIELLFAQYVVLVLLILLNSFEFTHFDLSESLLNTYITSVFLETLGVITMMIAFAFKSKEESNIVHILTAIIDNYQKYKGDGSNNKK